MRDRRTFELKEKGDLAGYAMASADSRGRAHDEDEHRFRLAFQRDRDRIIHSTAFRRLEYKTQVFVNHEGDYYRTRLTHTMECAQVTRTVARHKVIGPLVRHKCWGVLFDELSPLQHLCSTRDSRALLPSARRGCRTPGLSARSSPAPLPSPRRVLRLPRMGLPAMWRPWGRLCAACVPSTGMDAVHPPPTTLSA